MLDAVSNKRSQNRQSGGRMEWWDKPGWKQGRQAVMLTPEWFYSQDVFIFFFNYNNTIGLRFWHFKHLLIALVVECLTLACKFHFQHQSKKDWIKSGNWKHRTSFKFIHQSITNHFSTFPILLQERAEELQLLSCAD